MKFAFIVGKYMSRSLCDTARLPPPSATVMTVKKVAIPSNYQFEIPKLWDVDIFGDIPTGAKIS